MVAGSQEELTFQSSTIASSLSLSSSPPSATVAKGSKQEEQGSVRRKRDLVEPSPRFKQTQCVHNSINRRLHTGAPSIDTATGYFGVLKRSTRTVHAAKLGETGFGRSIVCTSGGWKDSEIV